ncbi:MAG: SAM-dependent methyltransferase [Chloroflexota bacterium]|nr:SAM-dependent methyltransferase [Chloroflexota bacterium]
MAGRQDSGVEPLATIERLIAEHGRITFARFMELALYGPGGYYVSADRHRTGDYFTAPSAHPAFSALLAVQVRQLWELMGSPSPFHVVEVGAGGCRLAESFVDYASRLSPEFARALEYAAVDCSIARPADSRVQAVRGFGLPVRRVEGCVLSNELPDAFPVHRFAIRDGRVLEVYVTREDGCLVETLDAPSTPRIEHRLSSLGLNLPDGFRGEVNLALDDWMEEVSQALARGFVLTVDYGHSAQDLYAPERSGGTLRCYYEHTLQGDPYRRVGRQDMTAHVDFTSLARAGEERGLAVAGFTSQREFLLNLGLSGLVESLAGMELSQRERDANRMGMLELAKRDGMGDFRVMAQARGVEKDVELLGFSQDSPLRRVAPDEAALPPAPLLSSEHLDLMAGRYPHLAWEWEAMWPGSEREE